MNIGIIVSFYSFRTDVKKLVTTLLDDGKRVIIFYRNDEIEEILSDQIIGVEYRVIDEGDNLFLNKLFKFTYSIFRKIPKSTNNYYLMEWFKISNYTGKTKYIELIKYYFQKFSPNIISYDRYLNLLSYNKKTKIEDIDKFIAFTEFASDTLYARINNECFDKLSIYVYSWDHPCKHVKFSRKSRYCVWSNSIKNDLIELQDIPVNNISVVGSTQFSQINKYLISEHSNKIKQKNDYILYCCSTGIPELVKMELLFIKSISKYLATYIPGIHLNIRPYPVLNDWSYYDELLDLNNTSVLTYSLPVSDIESHNYNKYNDILNSIFVLHCGSTIGLESLLLNKKSYITDFEYLYQNYKNGIKDFIYQYQNVKYLINDGLYIKHPNDIGKIILGDYKDSYRVDYFYHDNLKNIMSKLIS